MTKLTAVLGLLLGVSVLINGLTFVELSKLRAKSPVATKSRPGDPTSAAPSIASDAPIAADNGAILNELRQLRSDVAALRDGKGSSGSPVHAPGQPGAADLSDLPPSVASDPAVAKLLAEQEVLNKLWKDLGKLSALQKSLGDEKYKQLVMRMTGDFLGLDAAARAGFEAASAQMMSEYESATKTLQDATKTMTYDQKDPGVYQRQYAELMKHYNDSRKIAETRLDSYLTSAPRHQQFKQNLQTWGWYVNPKQWNNGDYAGGFAEPVGEDE
jgi:hypothetical protein